MFTPRYTFQFATNDPGIFARMLIDMGKIIIIALMWESALYLPKQVHRGERRGGLGAPKCLPLKMEIKEMSLKIAIKLVLSMCAGKFSRKLFPNRESSQSSSPRFDLLKQFEFVSYFSLHLLILRKFLCSVITRTYTLQNVFTYLNLNGFSLCVYNILPIGCHLFFYS